MTRGITDSAVIVRTYEARDDAAWDEYVARSPKATLYHTTRWQEVLRRSFGSRNYAWLAEDSAKTIRGILPTVHLRSLLFGNFLVSLPHSSYGGVCADDDDAAAALVNAAIETAGTIRVDHVQLRQQSALPCALPYRDSKVSMHLSLAGGSAALWSSFDAKVRSQIRRPSKDGFVARMGGMEELDRFYAVFATNMRDLGTPVFPRVLFENVLMLFPGEAWICVVEGRGAPVAAALLLAHRDEIEIPWASSLRTQSRSAPNMLLYWTAIQFAAERGYNRIDFGRSTRDTGTYHFKRQWGATPTPQYWYYWLSRPGSLPELDPRSPKYRMAISVWKRLPVPVATALGPLLVRYIP